MAAQRHLDKLNCKMHFKASFYCGFYTEAPGLFNGFEIQVRIEFL